MLGELPEEPERARGLTERETNAATAFYGKMDVSVQLSYSATYRFFGFKNEWKNEPKTKVFFVSFKL